MNSTVGSWYPVKKKKYVLNIEDGVLSSNCLALLNLQGGVREIRFVSKREADFADSQPFASGGQLARSLLSSSSLLLSAHKAGETPEAPLAC